MLCCYADELKEGFYPCIDEVAPALVPLLKFYFREEVRRAAVSAMPELLRSAKLVVEKGIAQGRNEAYVKQLCDYIIRALVEALHKVLEGVSDMCDESDQSGMRVVIKLKRGLDPSIVLNNLYRLTALQSTFSCNMVG